MNILPRINAIEKTDANHHAIAWWLIGVAALVFIMVVVGGLTRLTESGLSITEWKPVTGALPPMTEEHWQEEFDLYRQIPQYQLVNKGMSLDEFKTIYWWEWSHRFLGRLIGLAFFVPFVFFVVTRRVERALVPRLIFLFVLGGMQGVLGWWMVMSGLTDRTEVSQYRLAAHLGLATLIFGALIWTALDLLNGKSTRLLTGLAKAAAAILALIFLQTILGAFVAGIRAGLIYNTWPLMAGAFIPDGLFAMTPVWHNFFESHLTVQFQHRMTAYLLLLCVVWHWWAARKTAAAPSAGWLAVATFAQACIGIWTVLWVVPIPLGAAHQAGAMVVFGVAVWHVHRLAK
ncbi:cytochrome oxidase assembly [Parvibaculum lavamentivorans DS-1]|uniref:Heme A synthase n=1 Tax=Parvibaculum lavamentivorans (strain DS-1 / DSM 13023 / NCIMB 13966) TaxID=402881 RepID=CTAA_PARL1|nr:COX15/CtaA family protein [Parvibaculum lavamentivorans]A7HXA1.1 RecName: Full=Heme A synthase; Short=HAS; AltName: Full=Cytochrome aa3-controlling protein [Parvibaculum lavamentivorans DS-1]ABS64534.1 cytochrome oxidase assembly [Parvibaculum lavamentivorans DS-1]